MNNNDNFLIDIIRAMAHFRDVDPNILDDISVSDVKSFMFTISILKLRWYCKSEYYLPRFSSQTIGSTVKKKIEKSLYENSLVLLTIEEPIFEENVEYVKYEDEITGIFEDRILLQSQFKSLSSWVKYGDINASFFKEDFALMSEVASDNNIQLSDDDKEKRENDFFERLQKYIKSKVSKPAEHKGLSLDIKYSNGKAIESSYKFDLITFISHGKPYRVLIYPILSQKSTEAEVKNILFESYPKDEKTALETSKNSSVILVSVLGIIGILILYYFVRHFSVLTLLSIPIFYFWKFASKDNKILDANSNLYKQKLDEFLKNYKEKK
ncbi:MAG: hypothetical protein J0647_00760 [Campylobacteraceae bacterium]|nr:hypothetical protein [Campylobacteraceae bacterium]